LKEKIRDLGLKDSNFYEKNFFTENDEQNNYQIYTDPNFNT